MTTTPNAEVDLGKVTEALTITGHLTAEVMLSAMYQVKADPYLSIEDALKIALNVWHCRS